MKIWPPRSVLLQVLLRSQRNGTWQNILNFILLATKIVIRNLDKHGLNNKKKMRGRLVLGRSNLLQIDLTASRIEHRKTNSK